MNIQEIFPEIERRVRPKSTVNISEVARQAGVSRATFYRAAENPEKTTLHKLRSIAKALGYRIIVTFERIE